MFYFKSVYSFHIVNTISQKVYFDSRISRGIFRYCSGKIANIRKMPKEKTNSSHLKETKSRNSLKKSRYPPGEMYLCVLGNGSSSSSRALYMFTDHQRYLFNCGEGTQRLAQEHKMKLSKLDHIFITHKSWENLGGLLGLSLTIQDMGVSEITVHGPPDIDSLYEYSDSFIILKDLDIATKSYTDGSFTDDCMDVQYIPIFKSSGATESFRCSSNSNGEDSNESTEHKSKKLRLSESTDDMIIAFACKGHSKPGQLLLERCVDLGVPIGPLLGDLKNGRDITLPSGKVVCSKDVVSEEEVAPLFLVVECPSSEYLNSFVSAEKFCQYQENSSAVLASLVVHFTPPEILKSSRYQEWMQRFPKTTCHLILNSESATLNSLAVHRIQHQLNLLHPGMFSLLQENKEIKDTGNWAENVLHANTLERYYLRPAKEFDRNFALKIEPKDFIEEAMKCEGFDACLKRLQSNINQNSTSNNKCELYPEVTFLGTGSSIPCKVRNVSAIFVKTNENKYILMDCGEGTYGQLLRSYGSQHKDVLLHLDCIFISHIHADHHLGLIKVLKERERVFKNLEQDYEPVLLIGPSRLNRWLKSYFKCFENASLLHRFIECSSLEHGHVCSFHLEQQNEVCPDLSISTVPVHHCPDAHGVIVSSKSSNWKLVYSGDTTPCKRLVSAGQDCSLLIHEATMEDELSAEAAVKRHSTTSEAIKIGEEMNAKYTILTHFSQRYAKVPLFNENFHNRVGCAFDNMKVRPNELYILPLLIPALNSLFAENVEELHTKGNKRRQKIALMKSMLNDSTSKENVKT